MIKQKTKRKHINFLLENPHYQKLHFYLYVVSILLILAIYFIVISLFSNKYSFVITGLISALIGGFLVFHRDKIVKFLSEKIRDKDVKQRKEQNKKGLHSTLNAFKSKEKRKIKLSVGGKEAIKDRIKNFKKKISKKKDFSSSNNYIEVK